jgi:hypothetical protein
MSTVCRFLVATLELSTCLAGTSAGAVVAAVSAAGFPNAVAWDAAAGASLSAGGEWPTGIILEMLLELVKKDFC